jgi:hypothetical protein
MSRGTGSVFLAVAASALIAGCGGGGSSSTPTNTSASRSSSTSATTTKAATTSASISNATGALPPAGSAGSAVAAYCKSALAAAETHLSASQTAQFKSYCASFANDNPAQIKASEKTLCNQIIKDTVPAADRTLAGAVCAKL